MDSAQSQEFPVVFDLAEGRAVGIVHPGTAARQEGVVIAVGGPQYRVGSHRQFLLLARFLASRGTDVFRFDYSGMGDSEGPHVGFTNTFPQIRRAIDEFLARRPGLQGVTAWGLCDAASTIAAHCATDPRIKRVVLVNPWVRSDTSLARTRVKHYYLRRLLDKEFWQKVFSGKFRPGRSFKSLAGNVRLAASGESSGAGASLSDEMAAGLQQFEGEVLIVLCGADVTALEFEEVASGSPAWSAVLDKPNVTVRRLDNANHTFSRESWRRAVFEWTADLVDVQ